MRAPIEAIQSSSGKKPEPSARYTVVKTGSVGEGSRLRLSAAIKNSLGEFLKGTKVEIIALDARLPAAQNDEARQKECDFIVYANVSHKKGGGGGFGFGKMLAQTVGQTGIGHTGSTAGNIAGQMATTAIVTAGSVSGNVKNKDEVTLDLKLQSTADAGTPLAKSFKQKAKSDGDDIISAVVELAAQAILDAVIERIPGGAFARAPAFLNRDTKK